MIYYLSYTPWNHMNQHTRTKLMQTIAATRYVCFSFIQKMHTLRDLQYYICQRNRRRSKSSPMVWRPAATDKWPPATLPDLTLLDLKHTRKQAVLNMVEQEHHGDQRNKTAEDAHLEEAADEHSEPTWFHQTGAQQRTSSTETRSAGFEGKKKPHRDKICRIW